MIVSNRRNVRLCTFYFRRTQAWIFCRPAPAWSPTDREDPTRTRKIPPILLQHHPSSVSEPPPGPSSPAAPPAWRKAGRRTADYLFLWPLPCAARVRGPHGAGAAQPAARKDASGPTAQRRAFLPRPAGRRRRHGTGDGRRRRVLGSLAAVVKYVWGHYQSS
jgi:hypothetical protein